jgi:alkanesulfonate monooxygenase SsuD/methylene tetrahydromethanopterin reductase-like flavin-dependent oxidoreductase (luciferase family)
MKELWTKDVSEYHGTYYDFPPVRCFPKPARKPHPPVLLGGLAKRVLERVADYGDGWMPNIVSYDEVRAARAKLDQLATERGRDPKSIEITAYSQPPDPEVIAKHAEVGADRCVVRLSGNSTEEALANMGDIAKQVL